MAFSMKAKIPFSYFIFYGFLSWEDHLHRGKKKHIRKSVHTTHAVHLELKGGRFSYEGFFSVLPSQVELIHIIVEYLQKYQRTS